MSIISSDNIQIKYLILFIYRASSILNKKKSKFGPANILDSNCESCWNSDQVLEIYNIIQGDNQWLLFNFKNPVNIKSIEICFQGGFVGEIFEVYIRRRNEDKLTFIQDFDSLDINSKQVYQIYSSSNQEYKLNKLEEDITELKLLFKKSTDFYGRITIYSLSFFGL